MDPQTIETIVNLPAITVVQWKALLPSGGIPQPPFLALIANTNIYSKAKKAKYKLSKMARGENYRVNCRNQACLLFAEIVTNGLVGSVGPLHFARLCVGYFDRLGQGASHTESLEAAVMKKDLYKLARSFILTAAATPVPVPIPSPVPVPVPASTPAPDSAPASVGSSGTLLSSAP
ncbi:hypothetical protein BGZ76_005124 [Entomortierella beljakovae]|nr:hypothetical protein BGZ76_005124 [Entomortierella beljakovae]